MARIDLVAFGGGFASVPLLFHEIVETRAWLDASTFLDGIALGQLTPGPIVITATFVGYLLHGLTGVLCSFVGLLCTVAVRLALHIQWDWPHLLLAAVAFGALCKKIDILWVVLVGAATAIIFL